MAAATVARRSVVAASLGNAMEWYDFTVYAFFAGYIARNFFTSDDPQSAMIGAFVVFGTGFVARPLGAVVIGLYGDRRGRKAALTLSIGTMGAGTLVLALTPSAEYIGIAAPILLLVARLLQGFSAGGEIGGAAAFLVEHAPPDRRGRYAAWLQGSMGVCNLVAAVAGVTITTALPESAVNDWAWRLPFILGLLIIPVGVYIRRQLPETEAFEQNNADAKQQRSPVLRLVREYRGQILTGFLFSVLWTICVYAFVIYGPTYYASTQTGLGFTARQTFLASLVGNVVLITGCVAAGRAADRLGAKRVVVAGALTLLVLPLPCLLWLHDQPTVPVLLVVHGLLCAGVSAFAGVAPSVLPRAFPVAVRATGVALSYNIAATLFAGFTPAIMAWATASVTPYAPALWVAIASVACLIAVPALFRQIASAEEREPHPPRMQGPVAAATERLDVGR